MESELNPLSPESGVGSHSEAKRYFLNLIEQNYMGWFLFFLAMLSLSCSRWNLLLQHVGSSSLTKDRTPASCTESAVR